MEKSHKNLKTFPLIWEGFFYLGACLLQAGFNRLGFILSEDERPYHFFVPQKRISFLSLTRVSSAKKIENNLYIVLQYQFSYFALD